MKIIRDTILVGVLLMMLGAPVVATETETDITLYYGAQGGSVELLPTDFTLIAGASYRFPGHFTDWPITANKSWEIWIEDKDFNHLSPANPLSSGTAQSSTFTWWGGNGSYITIPDTWPDEVWICADCSLDTNARSSVHVYIDKGGNVVPEPITLAMTAIGILGVLGFVYRRKEE